MRINVTKIDTAWSTCSYRWRVFVADAKVGSEYQYILETLRKWFGSAEYFWGGMFLCELK